MTHRLLFINIFIHFTTRIKMIFFKDDKFSISKSENRKTYLILFQDRRLIFITKEMKALFAGSFLSQA